MSCCITCKKYTGRSIFHEACPLAQSVLCRRCLQRGHLTEACTEGRVEWERPTCLEDLIPYDVRQRWGISSSTPISFPSARGAPGTETEISPINTITIPEEYSDIKDFIKEHKIKVAGSKTKESKIDCIKAIRLWANTHGYRSKMEYEIPTCVFE